MIDIPAALLAIEILTTSWQPWMVVVPGLLIGLICGAIPGVSTSMAMAIFLPLTLYMDFLPAVLFLSAIFTGGGFGCAVPAILMNIPGTSSAVATCFDGYPMCQQGRHNEAMGVALASSCFGMIVAFGLLFGLVDPISRAVLRLGPAEMLVIAIWGLTLIASLGGRYMTRGLLAGAFGLLLGTIGMNPAGYIRGTADIPMLLDGIPVVPAMMGMFAASQLFNLVNTDFLIADETKRRMNLRGIMFGLRHAFSYPVSLIRGALIGTFVGAIPGVGSSISNLMSYAEAKRNDDNPETFGKGNPKGVVASEAANSSSEGGSMATMLALGIPGGGGTAILLAAFAMHNIVGGPRFIADQKHLVYAVIFGNFAQAVLLLVIGLAFVFVASSIVRVPLRYLIPSVLTLACFGAYAITGHMGGPITLLCFAFLGWVMSRYEYPVAATVVGLLLGTMVEGEALRTFQLAEGNLGYFLQRPIAFSILVLLVISLALPPVLRARRKRRAAARGEGLDPFEEANKAGRSVE